MPVPQGRLAAWCHQVIAQGNKLSEARYIIRRRRVVLAYRHGIAWLDSSNMGMPVSAIGTCSNLLDEPHGILPRYGLFNRHYRI